MEPFEQRVVLGWIANFGGRLERHRWALEGLLRFLSPGWRGTVRGGLVRPPAGWLYVRMQRPRRAAGATGRGCGRQPGQRAGRPAA